MKRILAEFEWRILIHSPIRAIRVWQPAFNNKKVEARLSESQKKLADEKVKAKALRANEKELKAALAEMTSKYATLVLEIKRLRAGGPGSNNVVRIKG